MKQSKTATFKNFIAKLNYNKADFFLLFLLFLYLEVFLSISFLELISFLTSFIILQIFIKKIGRTLPIKELTFFLFCLQFLVTPLLSYDIFPDEVNYPMLVDKVVYTDYVLPALLLFGLGLFIPLIKTDFLQIRQNIRYVKESQKYNLEIGLLLLLLSYSAQFLGDFFPNTLQFAVGLIINFKFVGIFYLLNTRFQFRFLIISIVLLEFSLFIFSTGVFIDFLIWSSFILITIGMIYDIKPWFRYMVVPIGLLGILILQSIKHDYREVIWQEKEVDKVSLFGELITDKVTEPEVLFDQDLLTRLNSRLNQGWILTKVLLYVPFYQPFANGQQLNDELVGILLPRVLFPDKIVSGGNQEKFTDFTGHPLGAYTTMNIGLLGDAYINYAEQGGWVFMFIYGLFLNLFIGSLFKISNKYPSIIFWIPFLTVYTVRAGNDFYIITNFMIKGALVVAFFFVVFRGYLKIKDS